LIVKSQKLVRSPHVHDWPLLQTRDIVKKIFETREFNCCNSRNSLEKAKLQCPKFLQTFHIVSSIDGWKIFKSHVLNPASLQLFFLSAMTKFTHISEPRRRVLVIVLLGPADVRGWENVVAGSACCMNSLNLPACMTYLEYYKNIALTLYGGPVTSNTSEAVK
jgi:hypothetical protein